jgi:DNA polymerase
MRREHLDLLKASLADLKKDGVVQLPVREETLAALRTAIEKLTLAKIVSSPTTVSTTTTTSPSTSTTIIPATSEPHAALPSPATPSPASSAAPATPATPAPTPTPPPPPAPPPPAAFPSPPVLPALPDASKPDRLAFLRDLLLQDPVCNANTHPGKQLVFGTGSPDAAIFFCGEAPGAEEEDQGEPFVGLAGVLLTKIIAAMGFSREQVFIGNIMKWRPDTGSTFGNRPPTRAEMAYCLPYLRAQLEVIQPKVIVALGNTAVEGLLGITGAARVRGKWQDFNGTPVMPVYHPSYLLRQEETRDKGKSSKRQVWLSLLEVMEHLALPISEKQRTYFL